MFKSKRNRPAVDADGSIRSTASSSRGDRDVNDLGMMSVPYDRIAPGAKPGTGSASGRYISSPNTNPTLTADGTALNLYADQLPARRESNRSESSTSTRRRDVASSDAGSIHSMSTPAHAEQSAGPTRTPSSASTSKSVRTAASIRGPNHHHHSMSSGSQAHPHAADYHSEFGASGSAGSSSTSYYRPSTPLELHQSLARSTTPQPSLSARPGTAMSTHSRHGRNGSTGRYPAFNASDTASVHTTAGDRSDRSIARYSFMSKGEMSFVGNEFEYPKPDEAEFDARFEDFIADTLSDKVGPGLHGAKNGVHRTSEMSAQQLRELPEDKKWTLMYSSAKDKWERARARQAGEQWVKEISSSEKKVAVKDEPSKYVKLFLDNRDVEIKDMSALGVCLRTMPLDWQQEFLLLQGPRVIANALSNISNRRVQAGNVFKPADDKDRETEILKALLSICREPRNAHYLEEQPQIVSSVAYSLTSPNLASRSLAIEILLMICESLPHGHAKVISGMTDLNRLYKDKSGAVFNTWLRNLKSTLAGRGRMGSAVGMSDELKRNLGASAIGPAGDAALADYASHASLLISTLQGKPDSVRVRCLIRNELDQAGAQEVYPLLRAFNRHDITHDLDRVLSDARYDLAEMQDVGDVPKLNDQEDPTDIFKAVLATVDGSRARDFFLGALKNLLLMKADDDIRLRYHQIVSKVVSSLIASDSAGMEDFDFATLTGSNVNQLVGQFEEQERLNRVRARAAELEATAQQLALDKAALEEKLADGGSGQVRQLIDKLAAAEGLLKGSRLATKKLQSEMDEMRDSYEKRIAALEAKIMELFAMLKENRKLEEVVANKDGTVDRQQLIRSLEWQEEIRKTIAKLEGAHRKQRKRSSDRLPVGRSGFDDDTDEDDEVPPSPSTSTPPVDTPKVPAKSAARRSEVKSGSQFVDAEDEIVREHIEASIAAGLNSSSPHHSPGNVPRSARHRGDLHRTRGAHPLINSGASTPKPTLTPRFVEELKGRRFSRSVSAPVSVHDMEDARSDATSRRESGSTMRTTSTQATSLDSPSARLSYQKAPSATGAAKGNALTTLDEKWELRPEADDVALLTASPTPPPRTAGPEASARNGADDEPSSGDTHALGRVLKTPDVESPASPSAAAAGPPPSSSPPPPSPLASMERPFNPFAAGLMAQIASKRKDDSDSDSESAPSRRPPSKHSFLADIAGGAKRLQGSDEAPKDAIPKGPPRPAFLAGIAGGMAGLKSVAAARSVKAEGESESGKTSPAFGSFLRPVQAEPVIKAPRKDVAYKASAKVRQLHWDKVGEIQTDVPNVWAVTTAEAPENEWAEKMKQFDIWSQMETTFSSMEAKKIVDKERQIELMSVLDPKVRKLVEIFMKGYKINEDPEEIRTKILACDEKYCTHIFLENLQKFLPNPEQVGKLNAHKSDTLAELMLLHPADRLMVQLIKIPRLAARVEGMLYRARFEERVSMLEETVEQTYQASLAIQDAPKFRQLLSLILMIGNYLNGNSYAGGAFGFKIASINKLVETKSPQGQNLLHFVERTVSSLFHDMEGFMDELKKVSEGSRHELQPVNKTLVELTDKLRFIDKEIKAHIEDEPIPGDRYAQRMMRFLAEARDRLEALNDRRITAESVYNETLRYFNEDPVTPSNVFFGIFKTFLTSYQMCQKQNLTFAEMEEAKQRRKEAAEKQAREKAERRAKLEAEAPAMDDIMAQLRANRPPRRRPGQRSSEHEANAASLTSLSLDIGNDTAEDTFGTQALSILNTLRQKGFETSDPEPVLPRTTRLSAGRLLNLSRLDSPTDSSLLQARLTEVDEGAEEDAATGEEQQPAADDDQAESAPVQPVAPSTTDEPTATVDADMEEEKPVAEQDEPPPRPMKAEEDWQDENDDAAADGDKTFTLANFSFEDTTPRPSSPDTAA